ncbi:MAG: prolyl oligopeptidase family serine peptidase [Acidobacteria bacterium]|nr:prolyl oligopeptidase family serine peptidase [Acidobacteriota bacterium]
MRTKRLWMALTLSLIGLPAAIWLAGTVLSWPARAVMPAPPDGAAAVEFNSTSGTTIRGWLFAGQAGQGVVLLLHGVRANRLETSSRAAFLRQAGYGVLQIDQQAHGESSGQQITFGYLESRDAQAALQFLQSRLPNERLGALGISLGGAAICLAEEPLPLDALILEMVYPDLHRAVENRVARYLGNWARPLTPLLEWQLKPRLGIGAEALRPIDHVASLAYPKLFIVGERDRHTPLNESQELFNAASAPKELWVVKDVQHENLHAKATGEYEQRVLKFFAETLRAPEDKRAQVR